MTAQAKCSFALSIETIQKKRTFIYQRNRKLKLAESISSASDSVLICALYMLVVFQFFFCSPFMQILSILFIYKRHPYIKYSSLREFLTVRQNEKKNKFKNVLKRYFETLIFFLITRRIAKKTQHKKFYYFSVHYFKKNRIFLFSKMGYRKL